MKHSTEKFTRFLRAPENYVSSHDVMQVVHGLGVAAMSGGFTAYSLGLWEQRPLVIATGVGTFAIGNLVRVISNDKIEIEDEKTREFEASRICS